MPIFDFFNRNKVKQLENQVQQLANRMMYEDWIFSGVPNYISDDPNEYLTKGYSGNTSVYSIINRIDMMRKQAVLRLVDKEGKDIESHELKKFIEKVNGSLSTDDFITQLLIYRLTIGEYFVYKPTITAGLNKGKVTELTCLPSADVEIIEGDFMQPIRGYKLEGKYKLELPAEFVYHSKMFNPNWYEEQTLHGMSPLKAAAKTVSKLNQIEITEQKGYENQGPPYLLFRRPDSGGVLGQQRLTDPQVSQLEGKVKRASKSENKGLPLILKDAYEKIDLGSNIVDMKTIESSNSGVIALCGIYAFPPELAGYGQKTYSNMATARKAAWTDCIIPNLKVIQDTFNECLINSVPEYISKGLKFIFDYSEVEEMSEGMDIKVNWMVNAGWSGNEIREATGQPRVDNPVMDEPRIPMGISLSSDFSEPLNDEMKSFEDYK